MVELVCTRTSRERPQPSGEPCQTQVCSHIYVRFHACMHACMSAAGSETNLIAYIISVRATRVLRNIRLRTLWLLGPPYKPPVSCPPVSRYSPSLITLQEN